MSFPRGTKPEAAIAVFFVDPATGFPLNVSGGSVPASPIRFALSAGSQQAVPTFLVDPVSGIPLTVG